MNDSPPSRSIDASPSGYEKPWNYPGLLDELKRMPRGTPAELRAALQVDESVADRDLQRKFAQVCTVVQLFQEGRAQQADECLDRCEDLVDAVTHPRYKVYLEGVRTSVKAEALAFSGHPDRVEELFTAMADTLHEDSCLDPSMTDSVETAYLRAHAVAALAALGRLDLATAEGHYAEMRSVALGMLNRNSGSSIASTIALIFLLQAALGRADIAFNALDLRGVKSCWDEVAPRARQLRDAYRAGKLAGNPAVQAYAKLYLLCFDVLSGVAARAVAVLVEGESVKELLAHPGRRRTAHATLSRKADELEAFARELRIPQMVTGARQAKLQLTNLQLVEQARAGDVQRFQRSGGIVTLGAFCLYLVVAWWTVRPSGLALLPALIVGLVVSLVAGFGTTALVYLPLLEILRSLVFPGARGGAGRPPSGTAAPGRARG